MLAFDDKELAKVLIKLVYFMPVYLVFFADSPKNFQLALRGPNLLASLEACKLRQGDQAPKTFFWVMFHWFHIVKIECPQILLKPNWSKIFIYQAENGVLAFENGVLAV